MNLEQYFKTNDHRNANDYHLRTELEPRGGVRVTLTPVDTTRKEDVMHFNILGSHMTYIGKNLYQPPSPSEAGGDAA